MVQVACWLRECAQMDDFEKTEKQRIERKRHLNETQLNVSKYLY